MITVADIKQYLNITDNSQDAFLQSLINSTVSEIENYCDRNFAYAIYSENYDGNDSSTLELKSYPPLSVTEIWYYDEETENYEDIIDGDGDTIANSTELVDDRLILRKDYTFTSSYNSKNIVIEYLAGYKCETGTGMVSITAGTKTLTGVGTYFESELAEGDTIQCEGQDFIVSSIASDTSLTITKNASISISSKSFNIRNAPNDLKQVCIEKTALKYFDSPQSKGRLGIASENIGAQASQSYTFKDVDHTAVLNKYKRFTV